MTSRALFPALHPPHIPGTIPVKWDRPAQGAIIRHTSWARVGNRVEWGERLFVVLADEIPEVVTTLDSGLIKWVIPSAVTRVAPGRTLALLVPDRPLSGPVSAPQKEREIVEVEKRVEVLVERALDLSLPFPLSGDKKRRKWWVDIELERYVEEVAGEHDATLGDVLLGFAVAWNALSGEQREAALEVVKGANGDE